MGYGEKYLRIDRFILYCKNLEIKTSEKELEHYEKIGVLYPKVRIIKPIDFVRKLIKYQFEKSFDEIIKEWPCLDKLYNQNFKIDYPLTTYIHQFDQEMDDKNIHIFNPKLTPYEPWSNFKTDVELSSGEKYEEQLIENYYSYWQAYQLFLIQQSPDLFQNYHLFQRLSDLGDSVFSPRVFSSHSYESYEGKAGFFDFLCNFINFHQYLKEKYPIEIKNSEEKNNLVDQEYRKIMNRFSEDLVLKSNFPFDAWIDFLVFLLEKLTDHKEKKFPFLVVEIKNDLIELTNLLFYGFNINQSEIENELSRKTTFWIKNEFRYLNPSVKEEDQGKEFLNYFFKNNKAKLINFGIQEFFIEEILVYCKTNGLFFINRVMSEGTWGIDEKEKFTKYSRYTFLRQLSSAYEYFLMHLALNSQILEKEKIKNLEKKTLFPLIKIFFRGESWIQEFATHYEDINGINYPNKIGWLTSEMDTLALNFLKTCFGRNIGIHNYVNEDDFYLVYLSDFIDSILFAFLYTWKNVKDHSLIEPD